MYYSVRTNLRVAKGDFIYGEKKVLTIKKEVPATWEESLEAFLLWKRAHGLSETTVQDYHKHVNILFKRHPNTFYPEKLKAAVLEHMAQQVKPATFNLRLVYLRALELSNSV